jgi:hypothetical protein
VQLRSTHIPHLDVHPVRATLAEKKHRHVSSLTI